MAEPWLKWMSTAPCLMRKPLPATWAICCDRAIAVWCCVAWGKFGKLLPILTIRHIYSAYVARCTWPAFAQLCSMAAKCGDQRNPNFGGSDAMTVPWSVGSVASKTETKKSASILMKLGIKDITSLLRCQRLRWYSHAQRDTSCRAAVRHSLVLPTPLNGTRTWPQYKMDMGGWIECWPCWLILLIMTHVYYENCESFTIKWHLHSPPPPPHTHTHILGI